MGSSNRHWPSMFKSKPTCNTHNHHHHHHHQWHAHDSNNLMISSACHRSPYSSGNEERSPEPKPRWNPKPEQIRILESIFNSGLVNPPRDEIRKIRTQLQEYGQVGDANVFYWFQNRKSRSKHKNRHIRKPQINHQSNYLPSPLATTSSSNSSSEKSPTGSVNQQPQTYFGNEFGTTHNEPNFYFTTNSVQQNNTSDGLCFSDFGNVVNQDQIVGNSSKGMLLTDLMMMNNQGTGILTNNNTSKEKMMKFSSYNITPPSAPTISTVASNPTSTTTTVPSTITDIQGATGEHIGPAKSTVFINDVAYLVPPGPLNVKEVFGDDAVLIHSYGHPVVTNEWGVTVQSLQHGAFYYLI